LELSLDQPPVHFGYFWERNHATTDAEGRFVLDHVMPGAVRISRPVERYSRYNWPEPGFAHFNASLGGVTVQPGQTARCSFDARVLEVRCRPVLPQGLAAADVFVSAHLQDLEAPMPDRPEGIPAAEGEERARALRAWRLSDAGRQYYRQMAAWTAAFKNFGGDAQPDMTLQARGMQPGRYAFIVYAVTKGNEKTLATTATAIEVTISHENPLVDLGDLQLEMVGDVVVGQTLPDLVCKPLGGQGKIQLADYRGRHVLLAAWGIDCGPCLRSMPKLAELYARIERDQRVALLGLYLSYDPPDRAIKYLSDHGYQWPQAIPGLEEYHVKFGVGHGVPNYMVIDPAGVVLSRGSDLTQAIQTLDAALAK
jgi:peroxiredoxin